MPKWNPMDLSGLKTYPLSERTSKVSIEAFAEKWTRGGSFSDFLASLPETLAGEDLRKVIAAIVRASERNNPVVMAMGAHVIKVGLNPIVIDLMERGVVTAIAMNGAGIIHDAELAMSGRTSEDVDAGLGDGAFGMARETGAFLSHAVQAAARGGIGLGEAVGRAIVEGKMPNAPFSILAAGVRLDIPVTVHVAMGTDVLHLHPSFDPAAAGSASHLDFRTFAAIVATLQEGVFLNIGSAVVMPEVFLKAVTLVRNLGHRLERFTTVNMDFVRQYRPMTNVVHRPTQRGGQGINLVGHHEILLPLIAAGVIEQTKGAHGLISSDP